MQKEAAYRAGGVSLFLLSLATLLLTTIPAGAEVKGYLEYGYSTNKAKNSDTVNGTLSSNSSSLSQRYSLGVSQNLYPLLRVAAGTTYDIADSASEAEGGTTRSSANRLNSYADLSFGNQLIASGFGYSQRTERPARTTSEVYSGRLAWRPEGLPPISITGSRLMSYDFNRQNTDIVNDSLSFSSSFSPLKGLDLGYSGLLTSGENRIGRTTTGNATHSLRGGYGNQFWNGRLSMQTNYSMTVRESTARTDSGTLPPEMVIALEGRAGAEDRNFDPGTTIVDNLPLVAQSSLAIPVVVSPDKQRKHVVTLRFDLSGRTPNPTVVRIVVPEEFGKLSNSNPLQFSELEATMVRNISWYFSGNGVADWAQLTTVEYRGFKTYFTPTNESVFVMEFSIAQAANPYRHRYLLMSFRQITETDLSFKPANIPELRIIGLTPLAESLPGITSRNDSAFLGAFDIGARIILLRQPDLSYDFGLRLNHDRRSGYDLQLNYSIVNGLSLSHRFGETLSGSAHARREDSDTGDTQSAATGWGAGFTYTPFPTLSLITSYSGRNEVSGGLSSRSHAVSLANSADLYRGVSLGINISGGTQTREEEVGESTSDQLGGSAGLTLQPHRALSITAGFSESHQWQSGTGRPRNSSYNRAIDAGLGFNPLQGLYLSASTSYSLQSGNPGQTTSNFGCSWAPFRDGALQLSLSYREAQSSFGDRDRSFVQGLRWNIRPGSYLDVGHQMQWSNNDKTGTSTEAEGYSANLRIAL